ncbi:acyl-CoA synthetase [Roseicella aquatilis]|uniref:3-methylmercaptopropionyl-CoA ligase n=1 Tax=Roseicella aquatilis TaxID=2527868 RepID=A0A4R4D3Q1_9PROT|nr:acyl-CoA synthetase [Roseicella aquatilis]TCZ53374.1 acyl-CoA synthetase [Roseicella aquatilis]
MQDGLNTLPQLAANHVPLSPISLLQRAARIYPGRVAVIHGARRLTYAQMAERSHRLAAALRGAGIAPGEVVAVLAPNIPEMLEAHYGVPMAGAVLLTINIRLDAAAIGFILRHSGAKLLLVDREFAPVARVALAGLEAPPPVIDIADPEGPVGEPLGATDYEAFLAGGDPAAPVRMPEDEWEAIALSYTSGTTGDPKGVVTHHRGAYLNACGNALAFGLSPRSVYLWTLPMFHCNGWTYTWAVTLQGGTHVCLRRVEPAAIFAAVAEHGVTHMCAAPVVLTMLIHAPEAVKRRPAAPVNIATGGAAPPSPVIARMEEMGFAVTHLYGLTECYGPATICLWQPGLEEMPLPEKSAFMARQGVNHPMLEEAGVLDPATMQPVPRDGATLGEIMLRGNTVMKGYLRNGRANEAAFAGGWFHTGDLGVLHPDGYIEVKDRAKDIVISGGENISTLEVEEVLYAHPAIMEAAVVAAPDEKWGEVPHAFVTPAPDKEAPTEAEVIAWCRARLAHFKCPKRVTFGPLPKTSTGKVQKFELRRQLRG